MTQRRIVFGFRVTCDTTPDQLRANPTDPQAVEDAGDTRFDRAR